MRIAILSDIHGDVKSLQAALKRIDALNCDKIVCAGDLIDYWFYPNEVIELLIDRQIDTVRGNHDRWSIGKGRAGAEDIKDEANEPYDASGWGLTRKSIRFLSNLPTKWDLTIEGIKTAIRHGSPKSDMAGIVPSEAITPIGDRMLALADADILIVGHTHLIFRVITPNGGLIINPGALLRERPIENPQVSHPGTFGILELPSKEFRVYRSIDGREIELAQHHLKITDRRRSR